MSIKYPLFKVFVDVDQAVENVREVLISGFINEGEWVTKFQSEIENILGTDQVVLTNSCTSALTLALHLSNVKPHDLVLSTPMTCVATNTPINNVHANVEWLDINPKTGMIDSDIVKRHKKAFLSKALMVVNWAGTPTDIEEIYDHCKSKNINLIQDAAHSFGARYNNKDISEFADMTAYSFQAIKHLTTGDGGCLVVKDKSLWERAKKLKWFGIDREATKDAKGEWKGQRWEVDIEEAGYKFNMNNVDAAIGMANVKHINNILDTHRKNAAIYIETFKNSVITPLSVPTLATSSYWVFTALVDDLIDRDKLLAKLNEVGIGAGLVHIPNDGYTCFKDAKKDLPGVRYFESRQISLPCGWWLTSDDIEHIAKTVLKLCNNG